MTYDFWDICYTGTELGSLDFSVFDFGEATTQPQPPTYSDDEGYSHGYMQGPGGEADARVISMQVIGNQALPEWNIDSGFPAPIPLRPTESRTTTCAARL